MPAAGEHTFVEPPFVEHTAGEHELVERSIDERLYGRLPANIRSTNTRATPGRTPVVLTLPVQPLYDHDVIGQSVRSEEVRETRTRDRSPRTTRDRSPNSEDTLTMSDNQNTSTPDEQVSGDEQVSDEQVVMSDEQVAAAAAAEAEAAEQVARDAQAAEWIEQPFDAAAFVAMLTADPLLAQAVIAAEADRVAVYLAAQPASPATGFARSVSDLLSVKPQPQTATSSTTSSTARSTTGSRSFDEQHARQFIADKLAADPSAAKWTLTHAYQDEIRGTNRTATVKRFHALCAEAGVA